jgi:GNAT superfamily N-acetyltransferase
MGMGGVNMQNVTAIKMVITEANTGRRYSGDLLCEERVWLEGQPFVFRLFCKVVETQRFFFFTLSATDTEVASAALECHVRSGPEDQPRFIVLYHRYIIPVLRRRGIGGWLLKRVEEFFTEALPRGRTSVIIVCLSRQAPVWKWLLRAGYQPVQRDGEKVNQAQLERLLDVFDGRAALHDTTFMSFTFDDGVVREGYAVPMEYLEALRGALQDRDGRHSHVTQKTIRPYVVTVRMEKILHDVLS